MAGRHWSAAVAGILFPASVSYRTWISWIAPVVSSLGSIQCWKMNLKWKLIILFRVQSDLMNLNDLFDSWCCYSSCLVSISFMWVRFLESIYEFHHRFNMFLSTTDLPVEDLCLSSNCLCLGCAFVAFAKWTFSVCLEGWRLPHTFELCWVPLRTS